MYNYVSDEAARFLLLEELADARPSFALQVTEVRGGALIHVMHVLLLQLGSFMIHPESSCDYRKITSCLCESWQFPPSESNSCHSCLSQCILYLNSSKRDIK